MNDIQNDQESQRISKIVEERTMPGSERIISGWQNYLGDMLTRMDKYLIPGRLVTFQDMQPDERRFFEALHGRVQVPDTVTAIFLPNSVIRQMLAAHPDAEGDEMSAEPTDAGVVLAARKGFFKVVLNAVFALAPFTPAIDIYDDGRLLAGYMYHTMDECIDDLTKVLNTHFKPKT